MKPVPERIAQWGGCGKYRAQVSQKCSKSLKTLESCTKLCRLVRKKILDRFRTPRYANHFLSPNHFVKMPRLPCSIVKLTMLD